MNTYSNKTNSTIIIDKKYFFTIDAFSRKCLSNALSLFKIKSFLPFKDVSESPSFPSKLELLLETSYFILYILCTLD